MSTNNFAKEYIDIQLEKIRKLVGISAVFMLVYKHDLVLSMRENQFIFQESMLSPIKNWLVINEIP
jgi:hypothetical protein